MGWELGALLCGDEGKSSVGEVVGWRPGAFVGNDMLVGATLGASVSGNPLVVELELVGEAVG